MYIVSSNTQKAIKHSAALHNMSEMYLNFKEYVLMQYFSNVVALLELAYLYVTSAQQTCQMARMEARLSLGFLDGRAYLLLDMCSTSTVQLHASMVTKSL